MGWRMKKSGSHDPFPDTASEPGMIGHSSALSSGPPSGPLSGPLGGGGVGAKKNARFKDDSTEEDDQQAYVEITLDVRGDNSVAIQDIRGAAQGSATDAVDAAMLARRLRQGQERQSWSFGSQLSTKLRQVSHELKRITSSNKLAAGEQQQPNKPRLDRTNSAAARALRGLQFVTASANLETGGWAGVERRFEELAVDGRLPRSDFGKCIGMQGSEEFAGELFDALARRRGIKSGSLTKAELREFWDQLSDEGFDARLQTFFDMVDKNDDGRITAEEVKEIIALSASANKLGTIQDNAEEYAALIMEELDPNCQGYIEVATLEALLLQVPADTAKHGAHSQYLSQMLSQRLTPNAAAGTQAAGPVGRACLGFGYFLEDNWKRIWVMALWLAVCAGLFTWKFIQYRHRAVFHVMGYCVTTAKGGAETTKLNMALILLPVCRNTVTWLRSRTRLGAIIPFDDNINFHKVVAAGVVVGVALHAGAHLTCDFPRLLHVSDAGYEPMKPFFGDKRPNNYWWFVKGTEGWTGVGMVVLMAIAYILAQPWFRRNRLSPTNPLRKLTGYNAFWYSHHLFVIVYVLFVIHGYSLYLIKKWYKKTTWMYLAIPVLLYIGERLIRAFRSGYETVKIQKVAVYPGNVMSLQMSKPSGFRYSSGQYMFVKCSDVSPLQWHPFTITSAPGDDYLSVHIQTKGDWTTQLKEVFSKVCKPAAEDQSGLLRVDKTDPITRFPRLLIDGPYGAPAQDYKNYDVLLLVGLGIGSTPFISILKDVMNNITQQRADEAAGLESGTGSGNPKNKKPFMTKRAYFYWVTREQGSFEWFRGVINEVADNDKDGVIELHNYCTSVYEEGDARSALILMLQALHHAKSGVDIVSGTRVKTHFARPNWRAVYKHVAVNHAGQRVGVFYCGRKALQAELRRLAADFSRKTDTKFEFHKENF